MEATRDEEDEVEETQNAAEDARVTYGEVGSSKDKPSGGNTLKTKCRTAEVKANATRQHKTKSAHTPQSTLHNYVPRSAWR